jgi:hypothetical protein
VEVIEGKRDYNKQPRFDAVRCVTYDEEFKLAFSYQPSALSKNKGSGGELMAND